MVYMLVLRGTSYTKKFKNLNKIFALKINQIYIEDKGYFFFRLTFAERTKTMTIHKDT